MVYILVLAGQGKIDPNDPAAAQQLSQELGGLRRAERRHPGLAVHLLRRARGDLRGQHRQARLPHARRHGRRVARDRAGGRRAQRDPRAGGDLLLHPLRHLVRREPAPPASRRSRGAHGRRPAAHDRHRPGDAGPGSRRAALRRAAVRAARVRRARRRRRSRRLRRHSRPAWPAAEPAVPAGPPPLADALVRLKTAALAVPRRAPQLPALLRARARGRRRRPGDGLLGGVRERLVHAHGRGRGAPHGARRRLRFRTAPPDRRWRRSAPRSRTSRTCCANSRRTSRPTATRGSTRRSWPSPARRRLPPDAAMGGVQETPPMHQGGFGVPPRRSVRASGLGHLIVNTPGVSRSCSHPARSTASTHQLYDPDGSLSRRTALPAPVRTMPRS